MNCKKARKYLPLYIESDLSPKKSEKVRIHLESCMDCRKDFKTYVRSFKSAKEWLKNSAVAWTGEDWKRTVQKVLSEKSESSSGFAPWPFRKGWAFAVMGAVMVVLVFFVTRPLFIGVEDFAGRATLTKRLAQQGRGVVVDSPQEVVSMTMVSKETGLKVVWVLNKNFNLEEKE